MLSQQFLDLDHFINYGKYEGRKPNKLFNVILPKYYRDKLNDLGILNN